MLASSSEFRNQLEQIIGSAPSSRPRAQRVHFARIPTPESQDYDTCSEDEGSDSEEQSGSMDGYDMVTMADVADHQPSQEPVPTQQLPHSVIHPRALSRVGDHLAQRLIQETVEVYINPPSIIAFMLISIRFVCSMR